MAALWPERARCLVTGDGYNIQNIPNANTPAAPEQELRYWYQHYFNTERGAAGLAANRCELIRLLWRLWSPLWAFDDATFAPSVSSWDNPDFVDVTISSYRHRYGNAPGDPTLEAIEQRLTAQPPIPVPSIALHGEANGLLPTRGVSTNAASPADASGGSSPASGITYQRKRPTRSRMRCLNCSDGQARKVCYFAVTRPRNSTSALRSSAEPMVCSGILVPGV